MDGIRIRPLILLPSLLLPLSAACSQSADDNRITFRKDLRLKADSLLSDERLCDQTLFSHGDIYTRSADSTLRAQTDSMLAIARIPVSERRPPLSPENWRYRELETEQNYRFLETTMDGMFLEIYNDMVIQSISTEG